ncbi:hypothetical protein D3622_09875 [Escherichia coli]|nr:hypothetical protein [Escherichia coli]
MRAKIYQLSLWIFISFLAIYAFIIYKGFYIGVALHQIAWIIIIASGLIARLTKPKQKPISSNN